MIDLHCHLLPGIDDGPRNLEDALAMARLACANGITHAVVTPHILPGRYENELSSIRAAALTFAAELQRLHIPLRLSYAAEVRVGPELMPLVDSDRMPYLGEFDGYKLLLLELPDSHIPLGADRIVSWLLAKKVRPVIAHPERNKDVMRNVEKIAALVNMGCLLQITAGSASGVFGRVVMNTTRALLEREWVSIMASDAHNVGIRAPDLEPGRLAAEKIIGAEASWALVRDTPLSFSKLHFA